MSATSTTPAEEVTIPKAVRRIVYVVLIITGCVIAAARAVYQGDADNVAWLRALIAVSDYFMIGGGSIALAFTTHATMKPTAADAKPGALQADEVTVAADSATIVTPDELDPTMQPGSPGR